MSKHPHAENMKRYAEDAAETDRPWERWGWWHTFNNEWLPLSYHPDWSIKTQYRRKWKPKGGTWMGDVTDGKAYNLGSDEEFRSAGLERDNQEDAEHLARLLRRIAQLHAWVCEHDTFDEEVDRDWSVFYSKLYRYWFTCEAMSKTAVTMPLELAEQCAKALNDGELVLED
jgi:hypothetical protein